MLNTVPFFGTACANFGLKGVVWLTGLSGSGKSTVATRLRAVLSGCGIHAVVIDGDELRDGICSGLGFNYVDRIENVRRAAEMAKLLIKQDFLVIVAMISPTSEARRRAEEIVGSEFFHGCYCDAPLYVCEGRDPKGLYKSARAGNVNNFTGLDSVYEAPDSSYLRLRTADNSVDDCAESVLTLLRQFSSRQ